MMSVRQILTLVIGLVVTGSVIGQPSTCPLELSAQQLLPMSRDTYALSETELKSLGDVSELE